MPVRRHRVDPDEPRVRSIVPEKCVRRLDVQTVVANQAFAPVRACGADRLQLHVRRLGKERAQRRRERVVHDARPERSHQRPEVRARAGRERVGLREQPRRGRGCGDTRVSASLRRPTAVLGGRPHGRAVERSCPHGARAAAEIADHDAKDRQERDPGNEPEPPPSNHASAFTAGALLARAPTIRFRAGQRAGRGHCGGHHRRTGDRTVLGRRRRTSSR